MNNIAPLPDASLLNHSFSSGWLRSWASAGVRSSRKIRTIRIITVDRPFFHRLYTKHKGVQKGLAAPTFLDCRLPELD
jgi:hypothetical protein